MRRFFKFRNLFLISFLAVAGIFSAGAFALNKQVNDTPIVEKADAANWKASETVYLRIFKAWVDDKSSVPYLRYNSAIDWCNYALTSINVVGGDETYYYYKHTFANAPTSSIYVKRYDYIPYGDDSYNTCTLSQDHGDKNLITIQWNDNWNWGEYCGVNLCAYNFQTPTNGSVSIIVKNSDGTSRGSGTTGVDNYIYANWKVTLTPTPSSGYAFSHWTESTNGGTSYVCWSGNDKRANPKTDMTNLSGEVFHGVSFRQYKSIYYVTEKDGATTNRIYAWSTFSTSSGSTTIEEYGSWNECWAITATTNVNTIFSNKVVHFNGNTHTIYKFDIFSDNFILRSQNGDARTEGDWSVSDGAAYYWETSKTGQDNDAGVAIALLIDEETARNAVPASSDIKQYSICGIDSTTISSLLSRYNGLSSNAKAYVDTSTVYTYIGDGTSDQDNISFATIFMQLSKMSGAKGSFAIKGFTPFSLVDGESGDNTTTIIIIIASSISLLSITALSVLLVKKRKAKQD